MPYEHTSNAMLQLSSSTLLFTTAVVQREQRGPKTTAKGPQSHERPISHPPSINFLELIELQHMSIDQ